MRNLLKRLVIICLMVTVVTGSNLAIVQAAEHSVMPIWDYTEDVIIGLRFSGTTAQCSLSIDGITSATKISGSLTLKRVSGNTETIVSSWSVSSNSNSLFASKKCTVSRGYTYKLVFSGYVYKGSAKEYISTETSKTLG